MSYMQERLQRYWLVTIKWQYFRLRLYAKILKQYRNELLNTINILLYKGVNFYGKCQVTYEKMSQKKKAYTNLENCRYLSFMMAYCHPWQQFFCVLSRETTSWWLYITSGSESRSSPVATSAVWSVVPDKWAAAIYPAYCQQKA